MCEQPFVPTHLPAPKQEDSLNNSGDVQQLKLQQPSLRQLHPIRQNSEPNRLIGRTAEESILLNKYFGALSTNKDSPATVVTICGESGLGKTKLAETLRTHVLVSFLRCHGVAVVFVAH